MLVRCSFTLEPDSNESHEYAIELLKRWQLQEKGRQEQPDASGQRRNRFHRDLYLSGLVLHQLAPTLPTLLPQVLTTDALTPDNVLNIMQASGLPFCTSTPNGLSEQQWHKLTSLLETASTAQTTAPPVTPVQTETAQDLGLQQQILEQLLEGQRQLQQSQQQLADMVQLNVSDKSDSISPAESINPALLEQLAGIAKEQEKLMGQLKALRSELKSGHLLTSTAQNDEPIAKLDDQLAKAARVKAKGIW